MDFKSFVEALLTGTPSAILVTLVGVIWQVVYVHSRDKLRDEQARRELNLELQKFEHQEKLDKRRFEHQKELETLRFEYEQRKWREELAKEISVKLVDIRAGEYATIWSQIESIAANKQESGKLTPEVTRALSEKVKAWRYSKGALVAEETTRDAAMAFQKALWDYDGSRTYRQMRKARRLFRNAMRADLGVGENIEGKTIIEITEQRNKIKKELQALQADLNISEAES